MPVEPVCLLLVWPRKRPSSWWRPMPRRDICQWTKSRLPRGKWKRFRKGGWTRGRGYSITLSASRPGDGCAQSRVQQSVIGQSLPREKRSGTNTGQRRSDEDQQTRHPESNPAPEEDLELTPIEVIEERRESETLLREYIVWTGINTGLWRPLGHCWEWYVSARAGDHRGSTIVTKIEKRIRQ